ncbi:DUF7525 family protein [Halospeciosus flavus]|uniref:Uncharacterized protein n=1 Tax=Halospeciosus flavus TaxID=3032283 RepID=A0ABD5Z3P0_9EURY|nr:hypothetical protein [Halospeciosus flavus]
MTADSASSDKSLGLGLVFGVVAAAAALSMFVTGQLTSAYGFVGAVLVAGLAVAALHVYE